jgi:DNA-binding LytR/AlgR family response regulator
MSTDRFPRISGSVRHWSLLNDCRISVPNTPRLPVEQGNRVVFVDFDAIEWIEAADQYVILHVGQKDPSVASLIFTAGRTAP